MISEQTTKFRCDPLFKKEIPHTWIIEELNLPVRDHIKDHEN